MKTEYKSWELRRLPGVTYDTLRTWDGRRNPDDDTDVESETNKKGNRGKRQPVLLSPIKKPGKTRCWVYGSDSVERIWWIRMLQMLGYKNRQIEKIFYAREHGSDKEIWDTLDEKINDLEWKVRHLNFARRFAIKIRKTGKLPDFPHKEGVDDIDAYLEVLPVDPKTASMGYEEGSKKFLKAYGVDKDALLAQSNTSEISALRDQIYFSLWLLWDNNTPVDDPLVFSLTDTLYIELFEKMGSNLSTFHRGGIKMATQGSAGASIDDMYGIGFSAFLAEAIFIYCFIKMLEEESDSEKEQKKNE